MFCWIFFEQGALLKSADVDCIDVWPFLSGLLGGRPIRIGLKRNSKVFLSKAYLT